MNKTKIEWVKNPDGSQGYTWNPITGCLNGCEYCYARKLANTRLRERYLANHNVAPYDSEEAYIRYKADPFYPRFWEDRLLQPTDQQKPAGIFTCDMSDLFGIGIPEQWTEMAMLQIKRCPQHRFYLLTKQPQNLIKFSPFPDNCWVGVTATDNRMFTEALVDLGLIKAKVKYISIEPFLSRIVPMASWWELEHKIIDQIIIGSQTKPYKPPKIEWVEEIALACTKAHIPLFLKDNLKSLLPNRMPFWNAVSWKEWDKGAEITMSENRYRQETPIKA